MRKTQLVWDLYKATWHTRTGVGIVNLAAIVALTLSSFMAFTVAGGTWMFIDRASHPEEASPLLSETLSQYGDYLYQWVLLASFACAFLLPAIFSLSSQSAVLSASGRERRLAILRLLGLSSRDITRMTIIESAFQSVIGIALGLVLSFLLSPLFMNFSFQARPVGMEEMILPWWGYVLVAAILLLVTLSATLIGMQRVRVSPLGVSKKDMPVALRFWRVLVFIFFCVIAYPILKVLGAANFNSGYIFFSVVVFGALFLNVMLVNLVSPYILQILAACAALLPGTAHLVSCRRIQTNARATWKRSSSMAFFGILAGLMTMSPLGGKTMTDILDGDQRAGIIFDDVFTGATLTLAIGFILVGMSMFLTQASEVFENADLSHSLHLMGVKRLFLSRIALSEVMMPLIVVSLFGFFMGASFAMTIFGTILTENIVRHILHAFLLLGAGWVVALLSIAIVEPLRSQVMNRRIRKND